MYGGLAGAGRPVCPQRLSGLGGAADGQPHQPVRCQSFFRLGSRAGVRALPRRSFRDQIAANIAAGGAVSLDGIAQRYAGFLPEAFRASIVDACERSISAVLNDNAVVLADTIVQKVLAPLLTPVISLVLFFVAFALLRMLVSLLVTVLGLVNKLPVIGAVNHWLGWGVGGIASLVDIYLVLCVVWALIVITGGNLTMLNDTVMSGSLYYKVFNVFNPFV